MTPVTLEQLQTGPAVAAPPSAPGLASRLSRPVSALHAVPRLATWIGLILVTVGLALLAVAWGRTAAIPADVALQVPYVISAGFTGVALVIVGVTIVNIDAKRGDSLERREQLSELRGLIAELRTLEKGEQ